MTYDILILSEFSFIIETDMASVLVLAELLLVARRVYFALSPNLHRLVGFR
jgi:hypothetical protein